MTDETTIDPRKPGVFFRAGWRAARRAPVVFVARAFVDLAATVVRLFALGSVVVFAAMHLGFHLQQGGTPIGWLDSVVRALSRPGALLGLGGMAFTVWLTLLFLDSITSSGIWTVLADGLQGRGGTTTRDFLRGAVTDFPAALKQRVFAAFVDVTLLSVTIGTIVGTVALARFFGLISDSPVIAPALLWAAVLTAFAVSAALVRLTTELVAAPMFLERVGLGEGILRAAAVVSAAPVRLYRLFVLAAAVLIPPLLLYWAAIMFQNLTLDVPELQLVASLVRMGADLVLLCGFAGFAVMLHAAFFAYYAWAVGRLDQAVLRRSGRADGPPTRGLEEFLPASYDQTVALADAVGPWDPDDVMERVEPPASPEPQQPGDFDLGAILRRREGDRDEEE